MSRLLLTDPLSGATPVPPDVRQEPLPVSPRAGGGPIAEALGLAVRQMIVLQVPRTLGLFDAQDFLGRKDLLEQLAAIVDPVVAAITSEAAEHDSGTHIDRKGTTRMLAEALEDRCVLSAFEAAAQQYRDDEDDACEPQGSARARDAMGGV